MTETQTALITGAASGIGLATAHRLAAAGYGVALLDIDESRLAEARESLAAPGRAVSTVTADVGDERQIEAALRSVADELGTPTVLVNCAGVLHVAPAIETAPEDFDRILRVNLRSVFLLSVAVARALIASGRPGSIVNVSSIHAVLSEPNAAAYTAAKGGIEAMSRTFASEWAPHGIRVNCVRPGATRTALTESLYTPRILDALAQRIPLARPAAPDEIAAAIAFFASPDAGYITGTTLDVDGGYIMDGSLPGTAYA